MNNLQLQKQLELVVKYNIQPEDVAVLISEKPVINTLNEGDKMAFLMSDFVTEGNLQQDVKNAEHIMYWKVKEEERNVKVTGIAWFSNMKVVLFNGRILEP